VWVVNDSVVRGSETLTSFYQVTHFKDIGLNIHDTMIYQKANPTPQKQNRYQPSFEYMFVISKGKPKTVNLLQEQCKRAGDVNGTRKFRHNNADQTSTLHGKDKPVKDTKPRTNIWTYVVGVDKFNRSQDVKHPAIFPLDLAKDHILSWSNEGDTVLDPFAGSGTTASAAESLNRKYIMIEKNKDYYDMIVKRMNQ
jgi:DNA modification methylase